MAKKKSEKNEGGSIGLQPLGDRVVVEREESEERTAGGILLPDTAKDKPARGTVLSVGDGRLLDDGKRAPFQVKPGDRVVFSSYAGDEFKMGERKLLLKIIAFDQEARDALRRGVTKLAQAVKVTLGPGAERDLAEELRLAHGHQGRGDGGQGDRPGGRLREHGRPDGPRSGLQDQRRGRRRHHHGHHVGRGHLQRRAQGRGGGRQSHGS
jgi:chaperonin GroES